MIINVRHKEQATLRLTQSWKTKEMTQKISSTIDGFVIEITDQRYDT